MNKKKIVQVMIGLSALAISGAAQGVDIPAWWHTRGVMNSNAPANDYAPANIGQLKNVAYQTWIEMTNQLSQVGINPNETDPTVPAGIKDGIAWSEVSSRPAGLDDGDQVGITAESDPQVGTISSNYLSKWNGSALVSGTVFDNGNVGIGTASPATKLEVNGAIKASGDLQVGGSTTLRPAAGTIRWNGRDFEGYNGTNWISLTTGGRTNVWPVAQNDTATTLTNTAVTVSVLANDSGEGLSVASVTQPANGTVSNGGTNVVYTPAVNFAGTNVFNYVLGSWYGSATGRVTVVVQATPPISSDMVLVQGGTLPDIGNGVVTVSSFAMGKYEVTWGEWQTVRTWAAANSYDLGGIGAGCADTHPVHSVNWYDVVKWCNARSQKEGRTPVYTVGGTVYKTGQNNDVIVSTSANGYRLPTDAEWEYAARGGTQSHGYTYSGGNDLNALGWYYDNSAGAACNLSGGYGTWPVGMKGANELGLYDMSGNQWEWCFDWYPGWEGSYRVFRGGSWNGVAYVCQAGYRGSYYPAHRGSYIGFRLALPIGQ